MIPAALRPVRVNKYFIFSLLNPNWSERDVTQQQICAWRPALSQSISLHNHERVLCVDIATESTSFAEPLPPWPSGERAGPPCKRPGVRSPAWARRHFG